MNSRNRLCEIQQMVYIRFTIPVRSLSRSKVQFLAGGLCEAVSSRLSSSAPSGQMARNLREGETSHRGGQRAAAPQLLPQANALRLGLSPPPPASPRPNSSPQPARCARISLETEPRTPRPECRGRTVPRAIAVIEELYFF